jgi:hypothetical protein
MSVFLGPWSSARCMSCKVRVVVWGDFDHGPSMADHTSGDAGRELGPLLVCFIAPMIHSWRQFKRARSALCRGACNPTPDTSRHCTGTSPCWPSSSEHLESTYRHLPQSRRSQPQPRSACSSGRFRSIGEVASSATTRGSFSFRPPGCQAARENHHRPSGAPTHRQSAHDPKSTTILVCNRQP